MATVFNIKGNVYVKQHIEAGGHGVYNDYGSQSFNPIPEALQTPRATEILKKLNEAGYLTESFQPAEDKSWAVMSIVAYEIGKALGLSNKFAPFEELWHHNNLSKNYDGALNTNSKVNEIAQIIREIIHI